MEKDFDKWNEKKKRLDSLESSFDFHEREVWWCSIGVNVGSEQHSTSEDFGRPVLIIRRFSPNVFWGIPLTTKVNAKVPFRARIIIDSVSNDVLIQQLRAFDRRRLLRKVTMVSEEDFKKVIDCIEEVVKKTNPAFAGFSEAEATVAESIGKRKKKSSRYVDNKTNGPRLRGGLGGRMAVRGSVIVIKPSNMINSTDSQLKIAARASLSAALILGFIFPGVFSVFIPSEARAAATISKSLSRPINEIGLVGWWTFDGPKMLTNVADSSGQGNNGSLILGATGNTSTTTAPGKVGQALSFDGVDDYVSKTSFSGDTGSAGTVSFWVKLNALSGGSQVKGLLTASDAPLRFFLDVNDRWRIIVKDTLAANIADISPSGVPALGVWIHLVGTWDASIARFYKNGVVIDTDNTVTTTYATINGKTIYLGSDRLTANRYLNGSLDDVHIYNRALSAAEITRLYQIGATSKIAKTLPGRDSLTSGLVGWWTMDGPDTLTNIADKSGQGNTGSLIHGGSGTTTAPGKLGQALNFDGSDDAINVGSPAVLDDLGPMTIALWANADGYGEGGQGYFITKTFNCCSVTEGWVLQAVGGYTNVYFTVDYVTTDLFLYSANGTFPSSDLGKWVHWVVTWDGTSSASGVRFYKNGVEISKGSTTDGAGARVSDATRNLFIGSDASGSALRSFDGRMDDVRVYNRALSATEVLQLYNLGR